ncbi:MAG: HEAT repeat domain-containing protein [Rhizonema sp. PD37]|nr:HEAT repeat domain-containing protein [Rhizonema sp. PD37]
MEKTNRFSVAPTPLLHPQTMSNHVRKIFKSPIFLFLLTFLLIVFFSLSWVNAEEAPKPKPQPWQIDGIIAALDDGKPEVKKLALDKLAKYESQDLKAVLKKPEDIARKAVNLLKDKSVDSDVRSSAAQALGNIRKLEFNEVVIILNNAYYDGQSQIPQWRFLSYFFGSGTDDEKILLKWFGEPKKTPDKLLHSEGVKTLQVFGEAWKDSQDLSEFRQDLARQIAKVTKKVNWTWQDLKLLQSHYDNLKTAKFNEDDTVQSVINDLEWWRWFLVVRNIMLVHLAIWLTLILAYPKSPQVQPMFWNPWLRRILGFGYIGIFLSGVPYLRRRLFEPFKPFLLADAGLENFNPQAYFPETEVIETRNFASLQQDTGEMRPITEVIPSITGQIVLEGDSGLGKSMFLRHLVKTK